MALIALVPHYVGDVFDEASPGHRYRLYLQFWNGDDYSPTKKDKLDALRPVCRLPEHSKALMRALAERSRAADAETIFSIDAASTAPFATGLGWEHPNENGFAFLDPYGLPYLPGSGVKGVLRQAARELAWSSDAITRLFGSEPEDADNPSQGALRFWDVVPELAGDKLEVDILNPHHRDYYQNAGTPHDADQPVPVFFLTVPPRSRFHFRVDLIAPRRLTAELSGTWKDLLQAAFEHAFDWLGFGAKTAVGYGAMQEDRQAKAAKQAQAAEQAAQAKLEAMSEESQQIARFHERMDRERGEWIRLGISGQWFQELRALAQAAGAWPAEEKAALLALVEAVSRLDAKLSPKKNDHIKKLLKSLGP